MSTDQFKCELSGRTKKMFQVLYESCWWFFHHIASTKAVTLVGFSVLGLGDWGLGWVRYLHTHPPTIKSLLLPAPPPPHPIGVHTFLESCLSAAPSAKETLTAINYHAGWTKGHSTTPLPPNPRPPHTHTQVCCYLHPHMKRWETPPGLHWSSYCLTNEVWMFCPWRRASLSQHSACYSGSSGLDGQAKVRAHFFIFIFERKAPACGMWEHLITRRSHTANLFIPVVWFHISHINCDYEPQQIRATVDMQWPKHIGSSTSAWNIVSHSQCLTPSGLCVERVLHHHRLT